MTPIAPVTLERFWAKVEKTETCWLWTAAIDSQGYGAFWLPGHGTIRAHRLNYLLAHGELPRAGLQLDHLCRVRHCCNPEHLQPVTNRENQERSPISFVTINAAKTHCPQGHSYAEHGAIGKNGWRYCNACNRQKAARRRAAMTPEDLATFRARRREAYRASRASLAGS